MRTTLLAYLASTISIACFACDSTGPLGSTDGPLRPEWVIASPPGLSGFTCCSVSHVLAADGDRVYLTDTDSVIAVDATDGTRLWQRPALQACCGAFTRLILDRGVLYVGYTDRLAAVDPSTGLDIWSSSPDHITDMSPFILDETAIYVPGRGIVTAVSRSTGGILWSTVLESQLPAGMFLADGKDVICFSMTRYPGFNVSIGPGQVGCLLKSSGEILWRFVSDSIDNPTSPTVVGQLLILGIAGISEFSPHRAVYAFDLDSGSVAWRIDPGVPPLKAFVAADQLAIACLGADGSGRGGHRPEPEPPCVAFRPLTGEVAWRTSLTSLGSDPTPSGESFFVLDAGDIVQIDAATGAIVRHIEAEPGEPFLSTPVIAGGRLFALSERNLRAYRLR